MPKKSEKTVKLKKLAEKEFEEKVLELADKGLTTEKIGEELRQQGIHSKEYSRKISKILKEKDKYVNPDIKNVEAKLERIKKHYEKNKQEQEWIRQFRTVFSRSSEAYLCN